MIFGGQKFWRRRVTNCRQKMAWNKRLWSVLTIYLEILLFCHALGAWPAIEYILKNLLGYYDYVCTDKGLTPPCDDQNVIFSRMYSLTYISLNLNKVIGALILDYYGMWWARSVSAVFVMLGCVAWIFASPANPWLVWVGLFLFVGYGTSLSFLNLNNTNFYPEYQGITIAFIAGCTGTSQFLYTILKNLVENNDFPVWIFWAIILACTPFIWWRTFVLNPKYMIPKSVPDNFLIGWESRKQLDFSNKAMISPRNRSNSIKSAVYPVMDVEQKVDNRPKGREDKNDGREDTFKDILFEVFSLDNSLRIF